ncbi:MAG: sigma-70 family RNA polymerase sigma factor [Cyclobacteriaceae bacterium]
MVKGHIKSISSNDCDDLWQLLSKGDRKGLEGLYRMFAPELFKYGLSMVRDEDFVQDCIQEVFIDLWKYHLSLHKADNVKVYLFKSLSHKIYRELKKSKKWKTEEIREEYFFGFSIESIESSLINIQREKNLRTKLANALEKLPLRQKQVINHLFFDQFSYEETSKMMGINLRSVYTLAWKAVATLKKHVISLAGIILII